jgi:hypothetical protein
MCGHNRRPSVAQAQVVMRNLMCGFLNIQGKNSNCLDDGFGALINADELRQAEQQKSTQLLQNVDEYGTFFNCSLKK